ncbi:junctional adhesion molecule-like [Erethizon dorsatum]
MFCPLKLILMPVLLDYSLGLNDLITFYPELTVHVGDSALIGCVIQNTEGKSVTKVDWTHSPGQHGKDEYVLFYYSNLTVPTGRYQNRSCLVGDVSQNDGSLLLQDVQEADQGIYTCEIHLENENRVFKKAMVLHVLPEDPKELTVHEGESALMGCHFRSTEEKRVTKVDWIFSSGQHAKEEIVLLYNLNKPVRYPQYQGRFQNRVNLVGNIARNDGAIMLQRVKESDEGCYTCIIYLGSLMFRKTLMLHVIQEEPQTTTRPEILGGNHVVIIVGMVCTTLLLLTGLLLIVKTSRNQSSGSSTALVKSLEDTRKASLESG